jgi:hypothetical protein
MKVTQLIHSRLESIFKHLKKDISGWLIAYGDEIVNIMKCLKGETKEDLLLPEGLKVVGIYHSEDVSIQTEHNFKIVGSPNEKMKIYEKSKLLQEKDFIVIPSSSLNNSNFLRLKFEFDFLEENENFPQKLNKISNLLKERKFMLKNEKSNYEIYLKMEETKESWELKSGEKKSLFFDVISFNTKNENTLVEGLLKQIEYLVNKKDFHGKPIHQFYHFLPEGYPHIFTLYYPFNDSNLMYEEINSKELSKFILRLNQVKMRETYHDRMYFTLSQPFCRTSNAIDFQISTSNNLLKNVHTSCPPSKVKNGQTYLVNGNYDYHHYMQDNFNDSGWGCAYRSLQTLISFFRYKGYSQKPVPSHHEIQQILIDMNDKKKNFYKSNEWYLNEIN